MTMAPTAQAPLLDVQDLTMGFSDSPMLLLNITSFQITFSQQLAMIGSSGSGKTTLLHLLAGLHRPTSGRINYKLPQQPPQDITQLSEAKRDHFRGTYLGYIFQNHHLLPGFTALENVLLGMAFTRRTVDQAWAKHLLEKVGLSDRLHYLPRKLSTGQQQRVAVARALANRPSLVLADEPTGSLDPAHATQVITLIRSLCIEAQSSLLLVTHDRTLAATFERTVDLQILNQAPSSSTLKSNHAEAAHE